MATVPAYKQSTAEATQQLVVFSLGDEEYGLPITQVQEIIRYAEPRTVASDAPWIRGVITLRGKIIPVCDLAARLGLVTDESKRANVVIVETDDGTAGVIVEAIEDVLTVGASQLDEVPAAGTDFIEAIARIEDRLIVLLNPSGIFAGIDIAG
jgi:purine-binding chemotaxis protein CheW